MNQANVDDTVDVEAGRKENDEDGAESLESWSDISSDSDIFHAGVDERKSWVTREDRELEVVDRIKNSTPIIAFVAAGPL